MSGNDNEAKFIAIIGTTGSGKTYELKRQLKKLKAKRTLIWSPKEAKDNYVSFYPKSVLVASVREVLQILSRAGPSGSFHIVFKPTLNQKKDTAAFDIVCKALLIAENLVLVAEELHTVTTATHAPDGWRQINFMGRGFGLHVFGLSQRPASVDKSFMASLSYCRVSRLPYEDDQKTMSKVIGVPVQEIAALTGYQSIHKDLATGKIIRQI